MWRRERPARGNGSTKGRQDHVIGDSMPPPKRGVARRQRTFARQSRVEVTARVVGGITGSPRPLDAERVAGLGGESHPFARQPPRRGTQTTNLSGEVADAIA